MKLRILTAALLCAAFAPSCLAQTATPPKPTVTPAPAQAPRPGAPTMPHPPQTGTAPAAKSQEPSKIDDLKRQADLVSTKIQLDYQKLQGLAEFQDYLQLQQQFQQLQQQYNALTSAQTAAKK